MTTYFEIPKNPTSKYKGVSWNRLSGKWQATICLGGPKSTHIGLYADEKEAARAYDDYAMHHFGELARPNFRLPSQPNTTSLAA